MIAVHPNPQFRSPVCDQFRQDRQTDRQASKESDRQAGRQTDKETGRPGGEGGRKCTAAVTRRRYGTYDNTCRAYKAARRRRETPEKLLGKPSTCDTHQVATNSHDREKAARFFLLVQQTINSTPFELYYKHTWYPGSLECFGAAAIYDVYMYICPVVFVTTGFLFPWGEELARTLDVLDPYG